MKRALSRAPGQVPGPREQARRRHRHSGRATSRGAAGLAVLLLAAGCASTALDWRDVRLVRDRADVAGCTLLTILKDEDMNDLRRRAWESGGDTVLVTGSEGGTVPVFNPTRFVADVYRCRAQG